MSVNTCPAVSIGMPVYNGAKYMREALDALLAQTFTDFELIISDNASSDDTQVICEDYVRRDSRIRYVRQMTNRGALGNFQYVLEQATAPYFMWAAADDLWDENWLEATLACARAKESVACFGTLVHIDAHARRMAHPANGAELAFSGPRWWRKLVFYAVYEGQGKANLIYALYPRKALLQFNFDQQLADYQILFRLLDHLSYVQTADTHIYKRVHADSDGEASSLFVGRALWQALGGALMRYLRMVRHYFFAASWGGRVLLVLAIPVKLLAALKFQWRKLRT